MSLRDGDFEPAAEYHDSPHDVFAEVMATVALPAHLSQSVASVHSFAVTVFQKWWVAWQLQEGNASMSSGEDAVIALLQTMTGAIDYETSFDAYCYLFAISRTPHSQTEIAAILTRKFSLKVPLTKAAVSKRVTTIKERLGLQPGRGMKSDDACKTYAARAAKVHDARKQQIQILWKTPPPSLLSQAA